jgi:hypothetical protein
MFHPVPERNLHPMLTAEEQLVLEQLSDYEYSAVRCASHQIQSADGRWNNENKLPDSIHARISDRKLATLARTYRTRRARGA